MKLPPPQRSRDLLSGALAGGLQYSGQDPNALLGSYQNPSPEAGRWEDVLQQPEVQQIMQEQGNEAVTNYLRDHYGLDGEYVVNERMEIEPRRSWLARNAHWVVPSAILGGIGAAQAAGVGAAGAQGGASIIGESGYPLLGEASIVGESGAPLLAGATLPSTQIGTGYLPALAGATPSLAKSGGVLSGVLNTLGDIAPILGEASAGAQDANRQRDLAAVAGEQVKLNRDKFALEAPSTRMDQSTRASALRNVSPTSIAWGGKGSGKAGLVPQTTGGAKDILSKLRGDTSPLADTVLAQNLQDQLSGRDRLMNPLMNEVGKESVGDKILGGSAFGASILGALNKFRRFA